MIHRPHGWVILKFTNEDDVFFKIFASWRGGYLDGDSWRLSSGSSHPPTLSECGNYWVWEQKSGSCYHLSINGEGGMSFYTERILKEIISSPESYNWVIERVTLHELVG